MILAPTPDQVEVVIGRRQFDESIFVAKARLASFNFSLDKSGQCAVLIDTQVVLCSLRLDAPDECGLELASANFKFKPVPLVADNQTMVTADFLRPDGHGKIVGIRYVNPATDADWFTLLKRCQQSQEQYALQGDYFKKLASEYPIVVLAAVRNYMVQAVAMGKYA